MRFTRLQDWLDWQESLHPKRIDPGLERAGSVARALGLDRCQVPVVTVAGTNGKGSTVAIAEAVLSAAGYRVGVYASPHVLAYNERVRIAGIPVDDAALMRAFAAIDAARGDTSLSYFEFGTLAALWCFREAGCQVLLLEVGMGGRLDATNLLDADVAVIVSVALDHCEWLGPDRDRIAWEKAGIARAGRPLVFGEPELPDSVRRRGLELDATVLLAGRDFGASVAPGGSWSWWSAGAPGLTGLPAPALAGAHQYANAAAALAALGALEDRLSVSAEAVRRGLASATLPGRQQWIPGPVEWVLDVAHNAAACEALAAALAARAPAGRTLALFGLMQRKDLDAVLAPLENQVDEWLLVPLPDADARPAPELAEALAARGAAAVAPASPAALAALLRQRLRPGDRVLAFGSFRVVETVLREVLPGVGPMDTAAAGAE